MLYYSNHMKLKLKRPIAFFDLEATGVNVSSDKIVEIAILKAFPDGHEEVKTWRVNPQMPIPLQASLIHGIYDEDIANAPSFKDIAAEVADFIGDSDLAGYNSNKYDIPLLLEEFLRADLDFDMNNRYFVDVQNIFHQMEQRTLKAAYKFYCEKDLINAHSAEADIRATYEVLLAQLQKYEGATFESKSGELSQPVQNDVAQLHQFTNLNKPVDYAGRLVYNEAGEVTINFGKHKGKTANEVFDVEPSYYGWMKNGDFPLYTKKKLDEAWKAWQALRLGHKEKTAQPAAAKVPAKSPKAPAKPINEDMLEQLKMKFGK